MQPSGTGWVLPFRYALAIGILIIFGYGAMLFLLSGSPDEYISKPIKIEELRKMLEKFSEDVLPAARG